MTQAERQYFALLRAALWNTPMALEEPIDWEAVMKIARHHGNSVLLSDMAVRMADHQKPTAEMLGRMQAEMRGNLVNQMKLRQILVSAVQLLREHNIEPVLLKGFSLAMLYPNPSLRQFGDIDIFVGLECFHQACDVLRGMPGSYNWGHEVDSGRHYNLEFGNLAMEIHRVSGDVQDDKEHEVYDGIERDGLFEHTRRVDLDGFEITVPSKEFMVFFTFYHAWHHFLTSGVGLRQLSDVAMTLHVYHGQLDLDKLRRWLDTMHLMRPWQTFGYLMVDCLGLSETEMPFYDPSCRRKARRLYDRLMREGNFRRNSRFKQRNPQGRLAHKLHAFFGVFVDFFYRARVFPSQAFREMRIALRLGLRKNMQKN